MNKKTLLIAIAVVIAGVMLGVIISSPKNSDQTTNTSTTPTNNTSGTTRTQQGGNQNNTDSNNSGINVVLDATPNTIKAAGKDIKIPEDYEKIDKASLKISYSNDTGKDLKNVHLLVGVNGLKGWGTTGMSKEIKVNKELSEINGRPVFVIPEIKSGTKNAFGIKIYSRNSGKMNVSVQLKTADGLTAKSNVISITVDN
jgi:hypothetical protein